MNLKTTSLIAILLVGSIVYGQRELTATEAVFTALENNYQILISAKQVDITKKNNRWSEAGLFPTVDLVVGQNNIIQDNTNNPFTFTPGVILNQSINPSLSLNWNIFSGFRVKMSKLRLQQLEEQSSNNATAIIETTIQDVLKAYYTAQLQKDRMILFSDIMAISRKRFQYYELKEKYSSSNSLEALQFRNQYLTDSTNYLMQDISYQNAMRNLILLMNDTSALDTDFILTDKIDIAVGDVTFENAEKELFSNNQNLKNQYISLELQNTQTGIQRSFLYPTLSFQAGVNPGWSKIRDLKDSGLEIETQNLSYYGNLNLRYTLFNNWKNKRAVEVSKIQEEIALMNVENMKKSLLSALQNLIDLYEVRSQLAAISKENLLYAKKAFKLAEERFDLGTINSIDLANFQSTYQNTMIQHYENLFNRMDTYLEIYKMTGKIGLEYAIQK
ncbi:MAG: TolC family protein [Crocinitomicaceae bacterium]|nr:TolC family protein [Crocinitomicaceae bacterium]